MRFCSQTNCEAHVVSLKNAGVYWQFLVTSAVLISLLVISTLRVEIDRCGKTQ